MQIKIELSDKEFFELYQHIQYEYTNKYLSNIRHRMFQVWENLKKAKPNQPNLI